MHRAYTIKKFCKRFLTMSKDGENCLLLNDIKIDVLKYVNICSTRDTRIINIQLVWKYRYVIVD